MFLLFPQYFQVLSLFMKIFCCDRFHWVDSGLFKPCNAPCGESGLQEPVLECEQVTVTGGVELFELADEYFCEDTPRPEIEPRPCSSEPCEDQYVLTVKQDALRFSLEINV